MRLGGGYRKVQWPYSRSDWPHRFSSNRTAAAQHPHGPRESNKIEDTEHEQ